MKNKIIFTLLLIYTIVNCDSLIAQETLPSIQNQLEFKYQDSLNIQLNKFGMKMKEFPPVGEDPCVRLGTPRIRKDSVVTLPWNLTDTIIQGGGDTTDLFLGKKTNLRNVYWIHGLAGDYRTWNAAAIASQDGVPSDLTFPSRQLTSINEGGKPDGQTYTEDLGIFGAASQMKTIAINHWGTHTERDFIIGHSQGGIVGRAWLRQIELTKNQTPPDNNAVHGLVTFATPHIGAKLLNNTKSNLGSPSNPGNKLPYFYNEACTSIGRATVIPFLNDNFFLSFIPNDVKNALVNKSCAILSGTIIPLVLSNADKTTTNDYYVGSKYLIGNGTTDPGLSNYTLKVPVAQIYGVEEEPVFWKMMSSSLNLARNKYTSPNAVPSAFFDQDPDEQLQTTVYNMISDFDAKYNYEETQVKDYENLKNFYTSISFLGVVPIALYLHYEKKENKARENSGAYWGAKTWLNNANEYYESELLGAKVYIMNTYCVTERSYPCKTVMNQYNEPTEYFSRTKVLAGTSGCTNGNSVIGPVLSSTSGLIDCYGTMQKYTVYQNDLTILPSDGSVLAESASYPILVDTSLPGVTHKFMRLDKTNHIQIENSQETKRALLALYGGRLGKFFETSAR